MQQLDQADRERMFAKFGRKFRAGEVIYREGDTGEEAFLLQTGKVRLIKWVRAVERSLMVLKPGDLFGESALLKGSTRSSTAIAITDGAGLALDNRTFHSLLESQPALSSRLVQQLVRRLRTAEDQIEIMMLRDTQSKIVAALLKAGQEQAASSNGAKARVVMSPMELSSRVGLDVEAVKRGVQRLREGEYLNVVDEVLEIVDLDALRRLYALLGVKDEIRGGDGRSTEEAG